MPAFKIAPWAPKKCVYTNIKFFNTRCRFINPLCTRRYLKYQHTNASREWVRDHSGAAYLCKCHERWGTAAVPLGWVGSLLAFSSVFRTRAWARKHTFVYIVYISTASTVAAAETNHLLFQATTTSTHAADKAMRSLARLSIASFLLVRACRLRASVSRPICIVEARACIQPDKGLSRALPCFCKSTGRCEKGYLCDQFMFWRQKNGGRPATCFCDYFNFPCLAWQTRVQSTACIRI